MDWQQIGALAIVGITVILFAWRLLRRRSNSQLAKHCDCADGAAGETPPSTVLRGRRGERPRMIVRLR